MLSNPISDLPPNDLYSAITKEYYKLACTQAEVKGLYPELRLDVKRALYTEMYCANYGTI